MAKIKTQYICQNCGYNSPRYLGRCPNCGQWNTLVEERVETTGTQTTARHASTLTGIVAKPQRVKDIDAQKLPRVKTRLNELNRVLGGGIVPGSLILIGGDPGIGKSTLLLQVSGQLSSEGHSVLYVSGEESGAQIKMRAERLSVSGDDFYIYPETSMDSIRATIDDLNPEYVVIDSVQTMQATDVNSAIGSVSQIREVTAQLMQIAKSKNITIFVVGHVTKGGALAGPKILEHMVDTVLYFEGDLHHTYRILRAVKNRFGSTNELGIFEMRT
ncbi:MAG: DNA repair protein RadA, partial [Lactobacillus sp.]|nr:DNA repair protein RadA [Lactobacillus sp.]